VLQVQELVDGFTLEPFAMLYKKKYPRGFDEREAMSKNASKQVVRKAFGTWLKAVGIQPAELGVKELELEATKLLQARLTAAYIEIHYICGVVHDDMHVGNILMRREDGAVQIIDWELSPPPRLPFVAKHTMKYTRKGEVSQFGPYKSNPMIGDRGTQCDSLHPDCICNFPYEFLLSENVTNAAYKDNYHCNLLGVEVNKSWDAASALSLTLGDTTKSETQQILYWGTPYTHIRHLLAPQQVRRIQKGWMPTPRSRGRQEL